MPITNNRRLPAFVAAILILLLSTAAFYLWYELSPRGKLIVAPVPRTSPANDTPRQPPQAVGTAVQPPSDASKVQKRPASESLIRAANLGKTITVEGVPVNYKNEAAIAIKAGNIVWIKGLSQWPQDLFSRQGRKVRVTGVLSEDYGGGAVVWDDKAGRQGMPQGHPVPPGRDLKRINHRFIILDAAWKAAE